MTIILLPHQVHRVLSTSNVQAGSITILEYLQKPAQVVINLIFNISTVVTLLTTTGVGQQKIEISILIIMV